MSDPIIKIEGMNKWFGDFQVLKDIDLEVEKNKKIVVCGPSGSGKSTLIRCINRLEENKKGTYGQKQSKGNQRINYFELAELILRIGLYIYIYIIYNIYIYIIYIYNIYV